MASENFTLMADRLQAAGYEVSRDSKGNYYHGMLRLAGDLNGLAFLRQETMIRLLLNAQIRKGIAYTFAELKAIALPREHAEQFAHLLQDLAGRQIFLRGYVPKCPVCNLELWYPLSEIDEHMRCQGCRSNFQLPLELDFSYRMNQLFVMGVNQGALSVLLTALHLHRHSISMVWDANYLLKKNGEKTELDFIALCDEKLFIAECKDNFKDAAALENQLSQGLKLAEEIGAHLFMFSTLQSAIPVPVVKLLSKRGQLLLWDDLLDT